MATETIKIKDLIRRLRALTTAAGCTEAEALLAAEKARKLADQHGIDLEAVDLPEIIMARLSLGRKRPSAEDVVWSALAVYCHVRVLWIRTGDDMLVEYVGFEPDIILAEYLHEVLAGACERAGKDFKKSPEYTRRRTTKTRRGALDAFRASFYRSLAHRLWDMTDQDACESKRAKIDQHKPLEGATSTFSVPKGKTAGFDAAASAGHRAARSVTITTGIHDSPLRPTALLGAK